MFGDMATCLHCGQPHPDEARFCPATGKPIQLAAATERVRPFADQKGVYDLLAEAARIYRANLRAFLLTAAVVVIPGSLFSSLTAPLSALPFVPLWLAGEALHALVMCGFVLPLVQAALAIATADRLLAGNADWRQHWALLWPRLPLLLSAAVPAALILAVGFFIAVLPGLVLSFFLLFAAPVVLFERLGGLAALRRSYHLVQWDWLRTALMFVVFGLSGSISHWVAGLFAPTGALLLDNFVGDLLFLLVMPVPIIGTVLLYLDVRRKAEGLDDDHLRAALETLRARG
jgi:hypothetical protein